jgi:hypothetical protein
MIATATIEKTIDESLKKGLLEIVEELKEKHIELGQKASGKWVNSLEVVVNKGKGLILGEAYTEQLTKGRPPGKLPPISPLEKWAKIKLGKTGKEALNVAWAVAVKISREGTEIYKDSGSDLIDGVITEQRVNELYQGVGRDVSFAISKQIMR